MFGAVQPKYVFVYGITEGNNDLGLSVTVNHQVYEVFDEKFVDQQDLNDRLPVYGTATWGGSYWAMARPAVFRYDIDVQQKGPIREIAMTFAPVQRRVELISYDIGLGVGEQRNIKPLSGALAPNKGS